MDRPKWTYPYQRWNADRMLTVLVAVSLTVTFTSIGSVLVATVSPPTGWSLVPAIVFPLAALIVVIVQWRQVMAGFAVSDAGIRVRTVLQTNVLLWHEIRDFVAAEADPGPWEWLARVQQWKWDDAAVMGLFVQRHDGELIATPIRLGVRPAFRGRGFPWTPGGPDEFIGRDQGYALLAAMRQRLARETIVREM
jgi:GNAT superfamily N-acetyltransferase